MNKKFIAILFISLNIFFYNQNSVLGNGGYGGVCSTGGTNLRPTYNNWWDMGENNETTVTPPSNNEVTVHQSSKLTEILTKYCVPSSIEGCTTASQATFISAKTRCDCLGKDGTHKNWTFYDTETRYCQDCIYGSFTTEASHNDRESCEPIKCPEGYVAQLITVDTDTKTGCPSGFALKEITVSVGCGTGFKLQSYDTDKKIFK